MKSRHALAVLFLALLPACTSQGRHSDATAPLNLVLISLDTLRADHLGCYGYSRHTSPNLDRLAAISTVFANAYSTAPKTPESHMSMFTSLYPGVHRIFTIMEEQNIRVLDEGITTFTQLLKKVGYTTVGFHAGGFVEGKFGFDRGFDVYRRGSLQQARRWVQRNASRNKFFLFYHTYHMHDPYTPRPPYDTMFDPDYRGNIIHDYDRLDEIAGSHDWAACSSVFWSRVDRSDPTDVQHLVALYDGLIAEMDQQLGSFFDTIDRYAPRTIVIVLSDHGEEFGEHGDFTHNQIYNEILRVPLIIKHPERPEGTTINEPATLLDLAPTILELLSIPLIDQFQGRSLTRHMESDAGDDVIFSELPIADLTSVLHGGKKLISKGSRIELYDIVRDPGERRNLLGSGAGTEDMSLDPDFTTLQNVMGDITERNRKLERQLNGEERRERLDDRTIEQLKALGYIDEPSSADAPPGCCPRPR